MKPAVAVLLAMMASGAAADHMFENRDIDGGAVLYGEFCAACHGANLEGQPDWRSPGPDGILPAPPHDVSGHTWHHDTPLLMDYIMLGGRAALAARGVANFNSGMPGFGAGAGSAPDATLTDEQALDILAYIRSTWPDAAREAQRQRTHGVD